MPVAAKKPTAPKKKPVARKAQQGAGFLGSKKYADVEKTEYNKAVGREPSPWLTAIKNRKQALKNGIQRLLFLKAQNKKNSARLLTEEKPSNSLTTWTGKPSEQDEMERNRICHALTRLRDVCSAGIDARSRGAGVDEDEFAKAFGVVVHIMQDFDAPLHTLIPTTVAWLRGMMGSDDQADLSAFAQAAMRATEAAKRATEAANVKSSGPQKQEWITKDTIAKIADAVRAVNAATQAAVTAAAKDSNNEAAQSVADAALAAQAAANTGSAAVSGLYSGGPDGFSLLAAGESDGFKLLAAAANKAFTAAADVSAAVAAAVEAPHTPERQASLQRLQKDAENVVDAAQTAITASPAATAAAEELYKRFEPSWVLFTNSMDMGTGRTEGAPLWGPNHELLAVQGGGKTRSSPKKAKKPVKKAAPKKKTSTK